MEYLPRMLCKTKPNFDDFLTSEEEAELKAERDKSVQRIEHHEGFIVKKHLPYGHWKVTCEDGSETPAELSGVYVRALDAKRAIDFYLEKLNDESTTD